MNMVRKLDFDLCDLDLFFGEPNLTTHLDSYVSVPFEFVFSTIPIDPNSMVLLCNYERTFFKEDDKGILMKGILKNGTPSQEIILINFSTGKIENSLPLIPLSSTSISSHQPHFRYMFKLFDDNHIILISDTFDFRVFEFPNFSEILLPKPRGSFSPFKDLCLLQILSIEKGGNQFFLFSFKNTKKSSFGLGILSFRHAPNNFKMMSFSCSFFLNDHPIEIEKICHPSSSSSSSSSSSLFFSSKNEIFEGTDFCISAYSTSVDEVSAFSSVGAASVDCSSFVTFMQLVLFDSKKELLLAGSSNEELLLWNTSNGTLERRIEGIGENIFQCLTCWNSSKDGHLFLLCGTQNIFSLIRKNDVDSNNNDENDNWEIMLEKYRDYESVPDMTCWLEFNKTFVVIGKEKYHVFDNQNNKNIPKSTTKTIERRKRKLVAEYFCLEGTSKFKNSRFMNEKDRIWFAYENTKELFDFKVKKMKKEIWASKMFLSL